MRAAAVQLNATEDTDRNLETADRLVREAAAARRRARRAAREVERARHATSSSAPEPSRSTDRASAGRGRRRASSASTSSPGRSSSASRARRRRRTRASTSAPTASCAPCTARSTCSTSRSTASSTRSPRPRSPAMRSSSRPLADGTGLGMSICYDLRFPELYRILAVRGAEVIVVPSAFTLATTRDHWEVLRAGAGDREPVLRGRRQPDRPRRRGPPGRRALDDRRSVGPRPGQRPGYRDGDRGRPGLRRHCRTCGAGCRRWRTAAPRPTRGSCNGGLIERDSRQAPGDPRRGRPRVRAPGLPHVPRLGHRRRGAASPTGSSTTTSPPRRRSSTRCSSSAGT